MRADHSSRAVPSRCEREDLKLKAADQQNMSALRLLWQPATEGVFPARGPAVRPAETKIPHELTKASLHPGPNGLACRYRS